VLVDANVMDGNSVARCHCKVGDCCNNSDQGSDDVVEAFGLG
jgi:hypothetical protein